MARKPAKKKAKKPSTDTPLMRQYFEVKNRYEDSILLFRMGDFFELFFDDAVVASEVLEVALTSRDKHRDNPVPMCGFPHHAATGYVRKLLDGGFKVAVCDQVEDPRHAKGLVKRAVTQVITPGVVLDADHLEAKTNNFLLALCAHQDHYGLAALDLSTFELRVTEVEGLPTVVDELARIQPKEVLYDPAAEQALAAVRDLAPGVWTKGDEALFVEPGARELVEDKGGAPLEQLELDEAPAALRACAAVMRFAETTQPSIGLPACRVVTYQASDYLQLDESTLANLEIFESLMERRRKGSLLWVLDATLTAMGGRMMRKQLAMPLLDVAAIRRRHDAVELLAERASLRQSLRESLRRIFDLERLTSRTVLQVVSPRELGRLHSSLRQLPGLVGLLREAGESSLSQEVPALLRDPGDLLVDVADALEEALVDEPPTNSREGGIIRKGYNDELDDLVDLSDGGKESILAIEARERETTGIATLKVRYNKVFGYFIEVTRANLKHVPEHYTRKQTLVNAERFVTTELAEHEARVLGAEEQRVELEQQLFEELRERMSREAARLTAMAEFVAMLDVLCGLADVAQAHGYVRPEVNDDDVITIKEGRHPVVERFMPAGQFVPNDSVLDPVGERMVILTGPNMAGKSTVMRQVALITIMAQVGSFVPADSATIGVVDRIFTRVGASDNLARGESTFMVEMREMATILRHATSRSLIVVDEIGRGTATYDGISIAWAVAEFLHDRVSAKCLFATHYHELCALAEVKPFVRNFNIAVQEWRGRVVFLRKLVPGGSSRSYGIEVARLAGLDAWVIARARQVLGALEGGEAVAGLPARASLGADPSQLSLFSAAPAGSGANPEEAEVLELLRSMDPDRMTPLEALTALVDLRGKIDR